MKDRVIQTRVECNQKRAEARYRARRFQALKNFPLSESHFDNPLTNAIKGEQIQLINAALSKLDDEERWIVSQHVFANRPFRDLVTERNATQADLKSKFFCAKRKLAASLAALY